MCVMCTVYRRVVETTKQTKLKINNILLWLSRSQFAVSRRIFASVFAFICLIHSFIDIKRFRQPKRLLISTSCFRNYIDTFYGAIWYRIPPVGPPSYSKCSEVFKRNCIVDEARDIQFICKNGSLFSIYMNCISKYAFWLPCTCATVLHTTLNTK